MLPVGFSVVPPLVIVVVFMGVAIFGVPAIFRGAGFEVVLEFRFVVEFERILTLGVTWRLELPWDLGLSENSVLSVACETAVELEVSGGGLVPEVLSTSRRNRPRSDSLNITVLFQNNYRNLL